jgi:hypothetical protein
VAVAAVPARTGQRAADGRLNADEGEIGFGFCAAAGGAKSAPSTKTAMSQPVHDRIACLPSRG